MTVKLIVLRIVTLAALAAAAASLLDDLLAGSAFCGFQSGCAEVTQSAVGRPAGIPLSALGLVALGVFYALTLFPEHRAARWIGPLAILAGTLGLILVLVQALVLEQFCRLCLLADGLAMVLATVELAMPSTPPAAGAPRRRLWLGAAAVALALPAAWAAVWPLLVLPPEAPEPVRARWVEGKVNVVMVTDFECPACRAAHPVLAQFLRAHADRVHVVELVMPLPGHFNARPAGRAYFCAAAQGQGAAMSEALFASKDLSPAGCERLASQLGLDLPKFQKCVDDPATERELDATAWVKDLGQRGLPLVWIQDELVSGAPTRRALEAAFARAERGLDETAR
jgi:protein-disulfide isomerase